MIFHVLLFFGAVVFYAGFLTADRDLIAGAIMMCAGLALAAAPLIRIGRGLRRFGGPSLTVRAGSTRPLKRRPKGPRKPVYTIYPDRDDTEKPPTLH